MRIPLQLSFHHLDPSAALEARVRELAERLERFSDSIVRCHVIIEGPPGHSHHGGSYTVHIDITVPGRQIAVHRAQVADQSHQDPYIALRDAFRAVRRRLQDFERRRRTGAPASELSA